MNTPSSPFSLAAPVPIEHSPAARDLIREAFAGLRADNAERREAVTKAIPALGRLCQAMRQKTGQGFTVRALLYSLWNGEARSLLEIVGLDWALRKDLCAVVLAFGFEEGPTPFFYDAVKAAVKAHGLWEWFIAESEVAL